MKPWEPLWNRLDPRHRRYLIVGLIVTSALSVFTLMALMVPEPRKIGERKLVVKNLLTDADPRALGIEGLASQLRHMTQRNEELFRRIDSLEDQEKQDRVSEAERQRKYGDSGSQDTRAEINTLKNQIEALRQSQQSASTEDSAKNSHSEDDILPNVTKKADTSPENSHVDNLFNRSGTIKPPGAKGGMEIRLIRTGFDSATTKDKPSVTPPSASSVTPAGIQKEDDAHTVFIPAGTLLSGNLLNGLDAPTGKKARKEPFPVLVRIKQEAILPNRFRADLRECFLVAAGYGDLSAERAYIRAETLSCIRQDGGVIEVPLDAYAVGEDGKLGLRGTIVSKQGQLMATSLLAGFAKGFSDAFGRVQVPVLMTGSAGSIGGSVPYQSNFNPMGMEGGGLRGVGFSMDRMAHYYMDLAENLFPVVEIDATRQIEFVVQRGTQLKLFNPRDGRRETRALSRPY